MSKTIKFLLQRNDPELQRRYLGIEPTPEDAKKVLEKLDSFGKLGIKGFDLAIATFAIMRKDEEHEVVRAHVNDEVESFSRPFNFIVPRDHDDHGLLNGYTYGLHVLPRHMSDVILDTYESHETVALIAQDSSSGRALLTQRVASPEKAAFENCYFGVHPSNAESILSYLVLPKPEAVIIIERANLGSLV